MFLSTPSVPELLVILNVYMIPFVLCSQRLHISLHQPLSGLWPHLLLFWLYLGRVRTSLLAGLFHR